jgi:hypothetical protein
MKQRCAGFAYLLENLAEVVGYIEGAEIEGIARLAKDIAEKASKCYEIVRAESIEFDTTKMARRGDENPS